MKTLSSRPFFSTVVLFAAFASVAQGQSTPKIAVHLDPQKTEIHWTLKTVLHTVHGTFQLKGGALALDPATGTAEGQILVDVTTGESGNKSRDGKMQREVLESQKYPEAFFHPMKFSGSLQPSQTENVTVDGTFNIHGKDHPLTLQLLIQRDGQQATATTHFVVPYVEWGMKDESTLMLRVEKQVEVDVTARGTVEDSPASAAK
jgi:polyisoprenoid-binding protein YceI